MTWVLLFAIALLTTSVVGSVALWVRSGETRVGLFGGLFAIVAAHQGVVLWNEWGAPLALNATTFGAFAGLAAGVLSVFVAVAVWRTLGERDRVETLHWDSMEAVRVLNELTDDERTSLPNKVERMLSIGTTCFGLEVGMVSHIREGRFEVEQLLAPKSFPIATGSAFALEETFCGNTLRSERPIGIEHISESNWTGKLSRVAFGFEAYLGAVVRVDGAAYGTLSFGSLEAHSERFSATDKDLIRLMAQWLGKQIERQQAAAEPVSDEPIVVEETAAVEASAPVEDGDPSGESEPRVEAPAIVAHAAPIPRRQSRRVVDPNRILERMRGELGRLAGPGIDVYVQLDPELGMAAVQRVPLGAIVRTLVVNARDAMPDGGELWIETANLELAGGEPGVIPAVAPDRYVTVVVRDSGSDSDADSLSRLFSATPQERGGGKRDPEGRLALSTVYRILQACGGDLSVDVEPGRGSAFTVYLPRAKDDRTATSVEDAAVPSAPPLPH